MAIELNFLSAFYLRTGLCPDAVATVPMKISTQPVSLHHVHVSSFGMESSPLTGRPRRGKSKISAIANEAENSKDGGSLCSVSDVSVSRATLHGSSMGKSEKNAEDGAVVVQDDLTDLLECLPQNLRETLLQHPRRAELLEVVLDLGRRPEARFLGDGGGEFLMDQEISREDLENAQKSIGQFGGDNRAGVEGTLHRISAIRNRKGRVIGLTCRVGRAVTGHVDMIRDLLQQPQSLLFLGRPGVGKTTVIREIARVLADELGKRVVIVDTSNEIGGDGDVPHPAIGGARRMQVPDPALQHRIMVEAVENHMPEVVIVDEIGSEEEALACRTIAERGVMLVGTAHGQTLDNIMKNPTLSDLVGGIQTVTLGDDEARMRGTQKSVLERKGPPTFPILIEMRERHFWVSHQTDRSVDSVLHGKRPPVEIRRRDEQFNVVVERKLYDGRPGTSANNRRGESERCESSLGSPAVSSVASGNPKDAADRTYAWASKLGYVPDKDMIAEQSISFSNGMGGRTSSTWDDVDFLPAHLYDDGGHNSSVNSGKRGSKRGPRGLRPR